jgi:hypothetical protein
VDKNLKSFTNCAKFLIIWPLPMNSASIPFILYWISMNKLYDPGIIMAYHYWTLKISGTIPIVLHLQTYFILIVQWSK